MKQSKEIRNKKQDLIEKAYEEPEETKKVLVKMLKPIIVAGNKTGTSVKPEKKLYKNLKSSENAEDIENALDNWESERYGE